LIVIVSIYIKYFLRLIGLHYNDINMSELMTNEDVAIEIVNDLHGLEDVKKSLAVLSSDKISDNQKEITKINAKMNYLAQNTGILAYNLQLSLNPSSEPLPINSMNDLQDEQKIKELAMWLNKYHPTWPQNR